MGWFLKQQRLRDLLLGGAILFCALTLVISPQESVAAAKEGLKLCGNVIIPSLFPFFVLSSLVIELGLTSYIGRLFEGVMRPLFRVSGSCASALVLGFIGGYPVGAKTALALYQNGQCSKTEAERLLAFCNNCGPAFILGVVGSGVFSSSVVGLLLYCTHLLASLCVGLLFRFYKGDGRSDLKRRSGTQMISAVSFPQAFTKSVSGALQSTLNICAFILFFSVFIRILFLSGVMDFFVSLFAELFGWLGFTETWARRFLTGMLEMSSGVSTLIGQQPGVGGLSMAAFMLGWAGLSVHCQVLSFIGDSGLSMRPYFVGKLIHGGLSAALMGVFAQVVPLNAPVSDYLAEQVETLAGLDFHHALSISTAAAVWVWLIFVLLAAVLVKKSSGKVRRKGV